jgi:hypothetical protein
MMRKISIRLPGLLMALCFFSVAGFAQNIYYLDSKNGNDKNSGLKPGSSWASVARVNATVFKPGDKLLIKAGTVYPGQLIFRGSGKAGMPIVVDTYGKGSKPRIDGGGATASAVLLENVAYWEVSNLEITNTGPQRQARRTGVAVIARNFGDSHHIYLRNLIIHDVNGSLVKNAGGGSAIFWHNSGDSIRSRFIDLRIESCHLYNCERNGIIAQGYSNRANWYPSLGVVIRGNLLEKIPGDGIVPIGCDGALIEYNIMRDSPDILSHEEAAAGIWPWSCDNTVIQFNEVSGHKAKWDGQGFDADWNCQNTIIQYNYSHDNYGGFLLICNDGSSIGKSSNIGTTGTIVRYNISINDGLRPYPTQRAGIFSPVFHITGPCRNTEIHNNIILVKRKTFQGIDRTLVKMENWGGPWPEGTIFHNNIFYSLDSSQFSFGEAVATAFSDNTFYGVFENIPADATAINTDPMFECIPQHHQRAAILKCLQMLSHSSSKRNGVDVRTAAFKQFFSNADVFD